VARAAGRELKRDEAAISSLICLRKFEKK